MKRDRENVERRTVVRQARLPGDQGAWDGEPSHAGPAYFSDQTLVWVASGPVCTGTAEAASGTMSAGFSFCT